MGQWGEARNFAKGQTDIRVVAHVGTPHDAFAPLLPDSLIDGLTLIDVRGGTTEDGEALLKELTGKYVGKPHYCWANLSPGDVKLDAKLAVSREDDTIRIDFGSGEVWLSPDQAAWMALSILRFCRCS
jgi:hypothetical protein